MTGHETTTQTSTLWTPTVRRPFRILAGVLAVAGFLSCIGWALGAYYTSSELVIPLLIILPFSVFMWRVARRGGVALPLSESTTTVTTLDE